MGSFVAGLDATAVNVALPAIRAPQIKIDDGCRSLKSAVAKQPKTQSVRLHH